MNIKFISNLKNDRGVELLGSTSLPHAGGNVNLNGSENWLFYSANSSPEDLAYGWSFGGYYGSSRKYSVSHSHIIVHIKIYYRVTTQID